MKSVEFHYAQAMDLMSKSQSPAVGVNQKAHLMDMSQVHATLALVVQTVEKQNS